MSAEFNPFNANIMKSRYNIALLPCTMSESFIELASKFNFPADTYILGKKSVPHITLCQFEATFEQVEVYWKSTQNINQPFEFTLDAFSFLTFNGTTFWISLLPNKTSLLHNLHAQVSNILGLPINPNYDPHLTLMNTQNPDNEKLSTSIVNNYQPVTDQFTICLGVSDAVGQFVETIYGNPSNGNY